MSDGDHYEVCCCCGTEYLVRSMWEVTASGLMMCQRCYFDSHQARYEEEQQEEAWESEMQEFYNDE